MVPQAFNPALGSQARDSEFEASLVYKASFRAASTTYRNPVFKHQNEKPKNKKKNKGEKEEKKKKNPKGP